MIKILIIFEEVPSITPLMVTWAEHPSLLKIVLLVTCFTLCLRAGVRIEDYFSMLTPADKFTLDWHLGSVLLQEMLQL